MLQKLYKTIKVISAYILLYLVLVGAVAVKSLIVNYAKIKQEIKLIWAKNPNQQSQ